jgi:hypothetical protein
MRVYQARQIENAGLGTSPVRFMIGDQTRKERIAPSMREPLSKLQIVVNALIPFLYADGPIEASIKRYFLSSFVACVAIGLAYFIAVVLLQMPLRINLMATMMFVWVPLYHLMGDEFLRHQKQWTTRNVHRRNVPLLIGCISAIAAMYSMEGITPFDADPLLLATLLVKMSYLFSLWSVAVLSVQLNWELFDARSVIVTVLGIAFGLWWYWMEHH